MYVNVLRNTVLVVCFMDAKGVFGGANLRSSHLNRRREEGMAKFFFR